MSTLTASSCRRGNNLASRRVVKKKNDVGFKKRCGVARVPMQGGLLGNFGISGSIENVGAGGLEWEFCHYCENFIPMHPEELIKHCGGQKHKLSVDIAKLVPVLTRYAIYREDVAVPKAEVVVKDVAVPKVVKKVSQRAFYCHNHNVVLEWELSVLMDHIKLHEGAILEIGVRDVERFGEIMTRLHSKVYVSHYQDFTPDAVDRECSSYEKFSSPFTLREAGYSGNFVCSLRSNIFSASELTRLTKAASFLERSGTRVARSEGKACSGLNVFGMRWNRGEIGWYAHKKREVYRVAETFATYVCGLLKPHYPELFCHLHNVELGEGFGNGVTSIGDSPFTSFSVSRDYDCLPHFDTDDYGVGFIIWFHEDALEDGEEVSLFAFPEMRAAFHPKHGDVMVLNPSSIIHCTRWLKKKNHLGIALFQKSLLFRELRYLQEANPIEDFKRRMSKKGTEKGKSLVERRQEYEANDAMHLEDIGFGCRSVKVF